MPHRDSDTTYQNAFIRSLVITECPLDESSDEESWEMIPSRSANYEKYPKPKATLSDWIPLYQEVKPLLPPTPEPTPFDPEIIYSFNFNTKYLLFITPILLKKTLKTIPVLEYLDISLDRMRCWKQFATLNQTIVTLVAKSFQRKIRLNPTVNILSSQHVVMSMMSGIINFRKPTH